MNPIFFSERKELEYLGIFLIYWKHSTNSSTQNYPPPKLSNLGLIDNLHLLCFLLFKRNQINYVRVGPKMGQIGTKLDKFGTFYDQKAYWNLDSNKGPVFIHFDEYLARFEHISHVSLSKNVLKLIEKSRRFVPFGTNLTQFRWQMWHPCCERNCGYSPE